METLESIWGIALRERDRAGRVFEYALEDWKGTNNPVSKLDYIEAMSYSRGIEFVASLISTELLERGITLKPPLGTVKAPARRPDPETGSGEPKGVPEG